MGRLVNMFLKAIGNFIRKFFFLINIFFGLYSLLVYQLVYSSNIQHWIGGFLMLSYPVVLIGNFIFFIIWAIGKSPKALLSFVLLLMTYSIYDRTFKFRSMNSPAGSGELSVFSFNTMYGGYAEYGGDDNSKIISGISETMETIDADIKCFQELYNDEKIYEFNTLKRLSRLNPFYVYMHSERGNDTGKGEIGLATFSKYPIVHKEEVYWPINNNGMLSTDIVINKDTIRVINFQLRSMGIRVSKMIDRINSKIDKKETQTIISQLKGGFEARGQEVLMLEKWITDSPYPVIIAGDMNEMPYGYAYGKIRKVLNNAFEDGGKGFGFTYRKILSFLRIDNQFYDSKSFKLKSFNTLNEYKYSDHYPLLGEYDLVKK